MKPSYQSTFDLLVKHSRLKRSRDKYNTWKETWV